MGRELLTDATFFEVSVPTLNVFHLPLSSNLIGLMVFSFQLELSVRAFINSQDFYYPIYGNDSEIYILQSKLSSVLNLYFHNPLNISTYISNRELKTYEKKNDHPSTFPPFA